MVKTTLVKGFRIYPKPYPVTSRPYSQGQTAKEASGT